MEKVKKCLSDTLIDKKVAILPKIPSVFKIKKHYYFKYMINGERRNIATGKTDKEEAEKFRDEYLKKAQSKDPSKLVALLRVFASTETNPKYIMAQKTEDDYTLRYAKNEATRVKHLLDLLPSDMLNTKIKDIDKSFCDRVRDIVIKEYGYRYIADDTFCTYKGILSWAYSMGYISIPVTFRMKGIKVKKRDVKILQFEELSRIAKEPSYFRSTIEMDKFYILLTTGLRRAELSAIQGKQLKRAQINGKIVYVLDISQSWKDENLTILEAPKWGIMRIIPLAKSTGERLWKYKKNDEDFLMKTGNSVWTDSFNYTRAMAGIDDDISFSPHKLRHALNTKLLELGVKDVLVQEYFGWHHQDRNKVQQGYTHIYLKALLEVSKKIEEIINKESSSEDFVWLD